MSPLGNNTPHEGLELDTEALRAKADDLERRVMQLTEIIRRLANECDDLKRYIFNLERSIWMMREFGLYTPWVDHDDLEPLLDNASWETVDGETELEAGEVSS